jgi:hypothetical protein
MQDVVILINQNRVAKAKTVDRSRDLSKMSRLYLTQFAGWDDKLAQRPFDEF